MSQHHSDPVEENIETHPVKLAIAVIIGAIGLVVGIIMLANFAVGSHRVGETDHNANTAEAIAQRIAPAATLLVESPKGSLPSSTPGVAAKVADVRVVAAVIPPPPVAGTETAMPAGGEGVYKAACSACHAAGIAGAPKVGDKSGWAPRIAKGKPTLYDHALKGYNAMPAKGGNSTLTDNDVKLAVDFLVAQGK